MQLRKQIEVVEANLADIDSLVTIVPRSFHPVNPYVCLLRIDFMVLSTTFADPILFWIDQECNARYSSHETMVGKSLPGRDRRPIMQASYDHRLRSWNCYRDTNSPSHGSHGQRLGAVDHVRPDGRP